MKDFAQTVSDIFRRRLFDFRRCRNLGTPVGRFGAGSLSGSLSQPKGYTDYTGSYDPVPTVEGVTLATRDMHMTDDVTIQPIPTYEVENEKGGITFIIGGK